MEIEIKMIGKDHLGNITEIILEKGRYGWRVKQGLCPRPFHKSGPLIDGSDPRTEGWKELSFCGKSGKELRFSCYSGHNVVASIPKTKGEESWNAECCISF